MRIKLFTHTDLDGIGCAIVANHAFGRENVDVEYCDYNNVNERIGTFLDSDGPSRYANVFVTDISVCEDVAERLDRCSNVSLLDHHATATWLNRYYWAEVSVEWPSGKKRSGTDMLYVELGPPVNRDLAQVYDFVEKVRRYDTWEWSTVYSDEHAKELNDLFHIIGRERFVERFTRNPTVEFTESERIILDIERGRREAYKRRKLRDLVVRQIGGYNVGIVFAEQYLSEVGNYLAQETPAADFIALINPSHSVSYRGIDKVDVGLFAKERGGGGHMNAAGSPITDEMRTAMLGVIFGEVCV